MVIVAGIGAMGAGAIWLLTGAAAPTLQILLRCTLLRFVVGSASCFSRLICGGTPERLLQDRHLVQGDLAGVGGLLIAIFLPSFLAEYLTPAPGAGEQAQLALGQIVDISGRTLDGGLFDLTDHRDCHANITRDGGLNLSRAL
jgi:hypothetical protein